MYRYVVLAAADDSPAARSKFAEFSATFKNAPEWSAVLSTKNIGVYHAGANARRDRAIRLPGARGAVLGALFPRDASRPFAVPASELTDSDLNSLEHGDLNRLTASHWGRYVCVLSEAAASDAPFVVRVMRDPLGHMSCHYASFDGVTVIFSHLHDCPPLLRQKMSVNWSHVANDLTHTSLVGTDTGITEISELPAGETLRIDGHGLTRETVWTPQMFVSRDDGRSLKDIEESLHFWTEHCVRSWGALYEHLVVSFSGGLDSSILLACLAKSDDRNFTALTSISQHKDNDERRFARLVAERLGVPLVEMPAPTPQMNTPLVDILPALPRSDMDMFAYDTNERKNQTFRATGAEAMFTGNGGDEIFYSKRHVPILLDYVTCNGVGDGFMDAVSDISAFTHKSVGANIAAAARQYAARFVPSNGQKHSRTLNNILVPCAARRAARKPETHPWIDRLFPDLPAKSAQIVSMAHLTRLSRYTCRAVHAEGVDPLYSQPLVEEIMSIPAYRLIEGGRDRARARAAFARDLPDEVVNRPHKGAPMRFMASILQGKELRFSELLNDGVLAKHRFIDSATMSRIAEGRYIRESEDIISVLKTVAVEVWLQQLLRTFPSMTAP